jgi:hypothetical protein
VPPDPPHQLRATTKTNVSITVSWTPGTDNFSPITGYKVNYRKNGTDGKWLVARNFSNSKATTTTNVQLIEGLIPLTIYEFKVRAKNTIGKGGYSAIAILTTHPNGRKFKRLFFYLVVYTCVHQVVMLVKGGLVLKLRYFVLPYSGL